MAIYNKALQPTAKTVTRFAINPAKQAPFLSAAERGVRVPMHIKHLNISASCSLGISFTR